MKQAPDRGHRCLPRERTGIPVNDRDQSMPGPYRPQRRLGEGSGTGGVEGDAQRRGPDSRRQDPLLVGA